VIILSHAEHAETTKIVYTEGVGGSSPSPTIPVAAMGILPTGMAQTAWGVLDTPWREG
jgi:hypothetical protein